MNQEPDVATIHSRCVIRPAQPCDCEAMAELARQLGYECTREEVRDRLDQMQDPSQYAVLVAELPGGQVIGWIGAYLFRSVVLRSRAEINGLVVGEDVRSRGVGKVLLAAVEEWARSIGCGAVSVRSNIIRERAHGFYIRNGYEHVKTQKELQKIF